MDFIFWKHTTPVGIRVEEVSGDSLPSSKVWIEMAMQIFCEHGPDSYREILHSATGVPVIRGLEARISITHTPGLVAVAFLPKTPEADLFKFDTRTAMGIDAEKLDRTKVLNVRERFLNPGELELIPANNLEANIMAWTAKEALLKASLNPAIDFRNDIIIHALPQLDDDPVSTKVPVLGSASLKIKNDTGESVYPMELYSYKSEDFCVTLAFSPKIAKYGKK